MIEGLTILSNLVLAKQGSQKFINVPRILRDLQMIQDAKDNSEHGGTLIEQLMANASAQSKSQPVQQPVQIDYKLLAKEVVNEQELRK